MVKLLRRFNKLSSQLLNFTMLLKPWICSAFWYLASVFFPFIVNRVSNIMSVSWWINWDPEASSIVRHKSISNYEMKRDTIITFGMTISQSSHMEWQYLSQYVILQYCVLPQDPVLKRVHVLQWVHVFPQDHELQQDYVLQQDRVLQLHHVLQQVHELSFTLKYSDHC